MCIPWFFGYGSLVNRATHANDGARPARLRGWRREWRHTPLRPVAFLTAVPDPGAEIDGLMAPVPGGNWAALDAREGAYDRVTTGEVIHDLGPAEVHHYWVPLEKHGDAGAEFPALLSYLDVVVQGYFREYGAAGVARFFATTTGWRTVADDRDAPRYSRRQALTAEEAALVDAHLEELGVARVAVPDY